MSDLAISTGDGISSSRANWQFTAEVARTFDLHVNKSVPFYQETHQVAVEISDWFVDDGAKVYDIGCSTGHLIADLLNRHSTKNIQCTGIDNSQAMLDQARTNLEGMNQFRLVHTNAMEMVFEENLSMVYALYTLQFIDPQQRPDFCRKVYHALGRRGAFVLVEKVLDADPVLTDIFIHLHWSKKEQLGFDVAEIYNKAQSLRGVLIPFTNEENKAMLAEAGFSRIAVFFKWCNFIGLVAIK